MRALLKYAGASPGAILYWPTYPTLAYFQVDFDLPVRRLAYFQADRLIFNPILT